MLLRRLLRLLRVNIGVSVSVVRMALCGDHCVCGTRRRGVVRRCVPQMIRRTWLQKLRRLLLWMLLMLLLRLLVLLRWRRLWLRLQLPLLLLPVALCSKNRVGSACSRDMLRVRRCLKLLCVGLRAAGRCLRLRPRRVRRWWIALATGLLRVSRSGRHRAAYRRLIGSCRMRGTLRRCARERGIGAGGY